MLTAPTVYIYHGEAVAPPVDCDWLMVSTTAAVPAVPFVHGPVNQQ